VTQCTKCGKPLPLWDMIDDVGMWELYMLLGIRPLCEECIREKKNPLKKRKAA